jgi:hypothetical protein
VLLPATADDPVFQDRFGAFLQGLQQSGWSIGRNVRIDTRWATANAADIRRHAAELAALAPDVILAHGSSTVGPLLQATRTVPVVFPVAVCDQVRACHQCPDRQGAGRQDIRQPALARRRGDRVNSSTSGCGGFRPKMTILKQGAPSNLLTGTRR